MWDSRVGQLLQDGYGAAQGVALLLRELGQLDGQPGIAAVTVGVADMGRWLGLGSQAKALSHAPFVRQRKRVFVVRHNHDDLAVLKELVEAGKVAPVIDRRYTLSEVPDALRHQGEGHAHGKLVVSAWRSGDSGLKPLNVQ